MENAPNSRGVRHIKQARRRSRWRFLAVWVMVSCVIMLLLSGLWSYLSTSVALTLFYQRVVLQSPASASTLAGTRLPVAPYLGYTAEVLIVQGNALMYYLYIPANYNPARKYPLVVVLHGGGEKSKLNNTQAQNEQLLLNNPYASVWSADYDAPGNPHIQQKWPCFVVIPQLASPQQWVNVNAHQGSYIQPAQPSLALSLTRDLLTSLQLTYSGIDASRLYITGLSIGGLGTWDAIERWPDYFAAAAPIAGAGDPSRAAVLKNLPIWAFHGSADPTIPVSGSRAMIAAIQAAGGHPKYTEFAGKGHGVWSYVYSLNTSSLRVSGFFSWLFSQQRK